MDIYAQMMRWVLLPIGLIGLIYVLVKLVAWARKGSKTVILLGAVMVMLSPDPIYEKNCRLILEAKHKVVCSEEAGDPPTPDLLTKNEPESMNNE